MAVQGAFFLLNAAKLKVFSTIRLTADSFAVVLCNSTQALSPAFVGASGFGYYADLTGELATANGYTRGGAALSGLTLTQVNGVVTLNAANPNWTFTGGGVTFKYAVIIDTTAPNKDILAVVDMDTSGGSVSFAAGAGTLNVNASGIYSWT